MLPALYFITCFFATLFLMVWLNAVEEKRKAKKRRRNRA